MCRSCKRLQHVCAAIMFEELMNGEQGEISQEAWGRWEGHVFPSTASQKFRA